MISRLCNLLYSSISALKYMLTTIIVLIFSKTIVSYFLEFISIHGYIFLIILISMIIALIYSNISTSQLISIDFLTSNFISLL